MNLKKTKEGWIYHHSPPNIYEIKLAKKIMNLFRLKKEDLIFNDRNIINPFEIDIWIPSLSIAIEFQGPHHYDYKNRHTVKLNDIMKKKHFKGRVINNKRIKFAQIKYNKCTEKEIIKQIGSRKIWEKKRKLIEKWDNKKR